MGKVGFWTQTASKIFYCAKLKTRIKKELHSAWWEQRKVLCSFPLQGWGISIKCNKALLGTACPPKKWDYCSFLDIKSSELGCSEFVFFFSLPDTAHRRHGKRNRWAVTGIWREKWKDFSSYCLLLLKHLCLLGLNPDEGSMCLKFWLYCIFLENEYWSFVYLFV